MRNGISPKKVIQLVVSFKGISGQHKPVDSEPFPANKQSLLNIRAPVDPEALFFFARHLEDPKNSGCKPHQQPVAEPGSLSREIAVAGGPSCQRRNNKTVEE